MELTILNKRLILEHRVLVLFSFPYTYPEDPILTSPTV